MSARDLTHSDFAGLELEADRRVSFAEQQDHMPPVGAPSFWMLSALAASPLLTIGVVSLVARLFF